MLRKIQQKKTCAGGDSFAIVASCFDFARGRKPVIIFP
jgi:hypothetical protein